MQTVARLTHPRLCATWPHAPLACWSRAPGAQGSDIEVETTKDRSLARRCQSLQRFLLEQLHRELVQRAAAAAGPGPGSDPATSPRPGAEPAASPGAAPHAAPGASGGPDAATGAAADVLGEAGAVPGQGEPALPNVAPMAAAGPPSAPGAASGAAPGPGQGEPATTVVEQLFRLSVHQRTQFLSGTHRDKPEQARPPASRCQRVSPAAPSRAACVPLGGPAPGAPCVAV
jgi:hypothetical protein